MGKFALWMIITLTFAAGITTATLAAGKSSTSINSAYDRKHGPCLSTMATNGSSGRPHGFCHHAYGAAAAEPLEVNWKLLNIKPPKKKK